MTNFLATAREILSEYPEHNRTDELNYVLGLLVAAHNDAFAATAQAARQEALAAVDEELAHATMNGHYLAADCQGVAPGEKPPAVRISNIDAVLERFSYRQAPAPELTHDQAIEAFDRNGMPGMAQVGRDLEKLSIRGEKCPNCGGAGFLPFVEGMCTTCGGTGHIHNPANGTVGGTGEVA